MSEWDYNKREILVNHGDDWRVASPVEILGEILSLSTEVERLQAEREALKVQPNVQRREKDAACAERDTIIERCAEVCDNIAMVTSNKKSAGALQCAAAIRAMKNDPQS